MTLGAAGTTEGWDVTGSETEVSASAVVPSGRMGVEGASGNAGIAAAGGSGVAAGAGSSGSGLGMKDCPTGAPSTGVDGVARTEGVPIGSETSRGAP